MGDFNYRIGLGSEKVRQLIKMDDLETLYENDQLNLQMVAGLTFPFYSESRITFSPTYKYDLGNDNYDTSEKARIPAWTDRILRKGTNLRQINYSTAPLRFSDHRPVFATFQCTVSIVDETRREALSRDIYEKRRADVGTTTASTQLDDTDDEDLIGYDPIAPGLPPASSDNRKWWLDNGRPARSDLQPPRKGLMPNPSRPSNPYTPTNEPDWVTVPRVLPRGRSDSETLPPANPRRSKSTTTNGRRQLPPPFIPSSTSVADLSRNLSRSSLQETPSRVSVSRTQQSLANHRISPSTTSSKKAPPPVARKPVHLASTPSGKSSPTLSTKSSHPTKSQNIRSSIADHTGFGPPSRRSTGLMSGTGINNGKMHTEDRKDLSSPPPPPQPRRPGANLKAAGKVGAGDATDSDEGSRPALPPRRPTTTTDLLGSSEGDAGMRVWEALKPS